MPTTKGGCVLISKENKKVALIFRPRKNDYSFPKGHMEEGEDVKACAIRETIEETACNVVLLREEPIIINRYTTSSGEDVEVQFYLANEQGPYAGKIAEEDREICKWVDYDSVEGLLTYGDLKEMWNEIKEIVKAEF